jgi:hypothetical protein
MVGGPAKATSGFGEVFFLSGIRRFPFLGLCISDTTMCSEAFGLG